MTRTRAILAATSVAAATAFLVAACGSDTADPPTPTASTGSSTATPGDGTSPSPNDAPEVDAPERPKDLKDDGPAGAEAAAVYFLELDDYIMKTGDTNEWEAMSHKSCRHCAERLDQAREIARRGDVFTGGARNVTVLHSYEQDAATGIWPIDVRVQEKGSKITDSDGSVLLNQGADSGDLRMEMTKQDGRWVVIGVADVPD